MRMGQIKRTPAPDCLQSGSPPTRPHGRGRHATMAKWRKACGLPNHFPNPQAALGPRANLPSWPTPISAVQLWITP